MTIARRGLKVIGQGQGQGQGQGGGSGQCGRSDLHRGQFLVLDLFPVRQLGIFGTVLGIF